MKILKQYAIYVLIVSLMLTGCSGVAGGSFYDVVEEAKQEIQAEQVLAGHGDVESCMFTIWYFMKPDAPPIGEVANVCKNIVTSMDEFEFLKIMEEIEKELSNDEVEVESVICTGNCI